MLPKLLYLLMLIILLLKILPLSISQNHPYSSTASNTLDTTYETTEVTNINNDFTENYDTNQTNGDIPVATNSRKNIRKLMHSIKHAIRDHYYSEADRLINEMGKDCLKLQILLRTFYMKGDISNNINILLQYANNSQYPDIIILLLQFTWNEIIIESNHRKNNFFPEIAEIYRIFIEKVIRMRRMNRHYTKYINELILNIIQPKLISDAIRVLTQSFLENNINETLKTTLLIQITNVTIFDKIIGKVIDKTYKKMHFIDLLNMVWNFMWTSQKASALKFIFWNLHHNMYNNGDATMLIAYYLKRLIELNQQHPLAVEQSNEIQNCINNLPRLVKNIYFSKCVHFRNFYYQNEMKVGDVLQKNEWRNQIELQNSNDRNENETEWIPVPIDEFSFKFKSKLFPNRYLFTGEDHLVKSIWRQVFVWEVADDYDGELLDNLIWHVTFENNFLYIKSKIYQEYLGSSMGYVVCTNIMRKTKYSWQTDGC